MAGDQIGVLLEIETSNHNPDNCFKGLGAQYTLSVPAAAIRDPDPRRMAGKIFEAVQEHARRVAADGFQVIAVATHRWQTWRDEIGTEVQVPFAEIVRGEGIRYVELGQERCNLEFRRFLTEELECPVPPPSEEDIAHDKALACSRLMPA